MAQISPTFEMVMLSGPFSGHRRVLSQTGQLMIGRKIEFAVGEYLSFPVPRRYQFSLRWDHEQQQFLFLNNSVDITRINGEQVEFGQSRFVGDGDVVEVECSVDVMAALGFTEDDLTCLRIGFSTVEQNDS